MTYQEYIEMREKLAKLETEYLETWNAIKSKRKRSAKLARLSLELSRLQDDIMQSKFYH